MNIDKVAKGTLEVRIQTNENLYNQQKTVLQSEVNKFLHSLNLLEGDTDLEMIYATLTAWGMHRMGETKNKNG